MDEALGSAWDFSSGVEANMTLYARWSSPRIFFDNRGGVGGANYVDATFASALPAVTPPSSDNAGVFRGSSFLGYFTEPTGGELVYGSDGKPSKICDFTKSITLYAQWKTVPAGLPYGGDLDADIAGQELVSGYFYNLTADLTLNGGITPENPYGSGLIMPANGRVAINLNGYNLKVVGAAAEGTRGGGAGIQMNNGSVLYICGNCGTFTALGGAAAAGVKGADGGAIWHNATDGKEWACWSGDGGRGGAGGGGAGAGVGGIGGTGGSGAGAGGGGQNITGSMNDPWANGAPGGRGADGGASPSANFTFVCVDTLKSRTLTGGASGAGGEGGAGGGDGVSKGAEGRFRHAGAGGGGGGGAGGTAGAGCGMGGGGGGQGGGGGGGGTDSNDNDHGNFNSRGGGFGGKGGKENGKDGASALQQNVKTHGKPGAGGGAGSVGAGGVAQTVYSYSSSALGDLTYVVTLDRQGGTGADTAFCYLGEVPGKIAIPVRTGYAFCGYYTEAYGAGTRWFDEKGEASRRWDTDIKKLYAYWTVCSYTVTLNPNGGSGGTASVTATFGQALPSVAAPERTGCTFNGFFDAKPGGVKYYNADGSGARTWDKGENTTLYAQWTGNKYVVTLPDGTKVDVTYGQRAPDVTPATKPGYTFNGYGDTDGNKYYNADGTPTGETWATLSDVSLVPLFTPAVYTVTLDAQGGAGGTASVKATYDALLPKVDVPARTGHTFLGYFDAAEGGKQYVDDAGNPMAAWDKDGDATLYAQWVVTTYTLTFDQQGGEGGTEYARVEYLAELPKVKIPALTGHTFLGYFDGTDEEAVKWYESNGGSTNVYEWLENKTLFAQWRANSYKYVLDGGSFTGEQAVVYGRVPANIRVPQSEENVFMGYFDEAGNMVYDAEGHYVGGAGYAVAGNTNLKAMWSEKPEVIAMVGAPKQRWPWNGKYDITYTAESLKAKNLYVVNVEMTVTEPGKAEPSTYTRLVQIPSENGEHTLMADFGEFVAAETLDVNATIRLRLFLTDSGENVEE